MEEIKNEKKKSNGIIIILVIILLFVFTAGGFYLGMNSDKLFNKKEDVKKSDNAEVKEVELKSQAIKDDLKYKAVSLMANGSMLSKTDSDKGSFSGYYLIGSLNDGEIKGDDSNGELYSVLGYMNMMGMLEKVYSNEYIDSHYNIDKGVEPALVAKQEVVSDMYKKMFGKELTGHKSVGKSFCFGYDYDSKTKAYYYPEPRCGGTSPIIIYKYENKYTMKNDEAYLYVSYGEYDDNKIYKDLKEKEIYKATSETESEQEFSINESNYKDFSEYKFTFKLDDNGNYYFVKVENTK